MRMNNQSKQKLEEFMNFSGVRWLSAPQQAYYKELQRSLLEAEEKPREKILELAKRIKPLVRLQKTSTQGYRVSFEPPHPSDILVFPQPISIQESYLFNFHDIKQAVHRNHEPLLAEGLKEVGSFTCYHHVNSIEQWFRPTVEEVLQQLPSKYENTPIDAFEITVDSMSITDIYDPCLDRHMSEVVLYTLENGLPLQIRQQPVREGNFHH